MAILITVVESTNQIISGIPEYVVVESNTPAVIFYTFDGTDPTVNSDYMESNTLVLPTDLSSVQLKLVGIAGIDSSEIFEHEWATVVPFVTRRFKDTDGISILPAGAEIVDSLAVGVDGAAARETSIPFVDLEMKGSDRDVYKRYDGGKTSLPFINFNLQMIMASDVPYQSKSSSPNNNNLDFDPKAGLIIIDGSTPEKLASQSVKIINRPYNTMSVRSSEYNEHLIQQPIITGNLVRYMTNPRTGITVFYYFDSRECRWIQSIQQITPKQLNIGNLVGNPRVFAWVTDPVMSKIF